MRNYSFFNNYRRLITVVIIAWLMFSILATACSSAAPEETTTPTAPAVTGTAAPAENGTPPAEGAPPSEVAQMEEDTPPAEEESVESVKDVATAVSARTPVPTSTPDRIDRKIEYITTQTGLTGRTFLGLPIEYWINLIISILIALAGYFIVIKLLTKLLTRLVNRTEEKLDDEILDLIVKYLNWLLLLLLIRFALLRLDFLEETIRTIINDLIFISGVGIISVIAMDIIQFAVDRYKASLVTDEDQRKLTPVIITVKRLAQTAVLIVAFSIILSHFGINISIILVILVVSGFIISFGAQDILSDVLSGYIILIDKPFRVGDSILIKELDTRGVVLEIGTRSTQIKTGDNREVIIPNSSIGQSQVVNYTYPDSQFRVQTDIGVAYGTDVEKMHKVIEEAVRGVEGVLHDKPVNIYYLKFGDSARMVRVRWWIDTYKDEKPMLDKVNSVLELALGDAGIELPNNTYDLNVKMNE